MISVGRPRFSICDTRLPSEDVTGDGVNARPDALLAETFAEIARYLQAEAGPDDTRAAVTRAAVATIDGCQHAAISVAHRNGRMQTVAPTGPVPNAVDAIQYDEREGPCVYALKGEDSVYLTDDLSEEKRWPAFCRRAVAETPIRSMLSLQLYVRDDTMGALNLYSPDTHAFDESSRTMGVILAAHAAVALEAADSRERSEHLSAALVTNRRIGTAMGILMSRRHVTEAQAFDALRLASQHLNTKLHDIADDVIRTGDLPEPDRPLRRG